MKDKPFVSLIRPPHFVEVHLRFGGQMMECPEKRSDLLASLGSHHGCLCFCLRSGDTAVDGRARSRDHGHAR